MEYLEKLKFNADGLIPAIIQDAQNGRVLMMAWMNATALEKTIETGKTHFWSRSRQKYWMKGESSGHTQKVVDCAYDCDGDTLLLQVEQEGAACHLHQRSRPERGDYRTDATVSRRNIRLQEVVIQDQDGLSKAYEDHLRAWHWGSHLQ